MKDSRVLARVALTAPPSTPSSKLMVVPRVAQALRAILRQVALQPQVTAGFHPPGLYIIMDTLKNESGRRHGARKTTAGVPEAMRSVRTLGLLGTGVIGGGWAARALHFGIDVVAADVKPAMEEWLRGAVANAEGALARLTFAPLPPKGRLTFTTDLHAMARQADFIQENIPEQLELKQRVLAEASRHA